ncbi:MAG: hypothetical protein LBD85_00285 [Oscillospiraceae bacterium]|jgi:ABC-type glycerol-3-phosphate transport system substrate-binding protein|nr:hypothetical protein [Oscillospiraceae bacterium]
MKKTIALLLALCMVFALFAACGSSDDTDDAPVATEVPAEQPAEQPAGGDETSDLPPLDITPEELPHAGDDNLAVNADGTLKYDVDDKGYPLGWYEYDLPLTTGSDTLVYWDPTLMPFQVVNSEGANGLYQTTLRNTTGVNIEYQTVDFAGAQQAFSVILASSDFTDIMGSVAGPFGFWAAAGGGTSSDMIDQGFFANIADYRAYAPNFMFQIPRFDYDPELINAVWLNEEMITNMGPYIENPLPGTGWCIRSDWLEKIGAGAPTDIFTYDQLYDVSTRMKNEIFDGGTTGYPFFFATTIELQAGAFYAGMDTALLNTAPMVKVVDGQVGFTLTQDIDYQAIELFLKWLDEGLIDPDYTTYGTTDVAKSQLLSDKLGIVPINPGEIQGLEQYNTVTPNATWDPMHSPALTADWDWKYAHSQGRYSYVGGGWAFAKTGKNIPLAISYADWFYSDTGSLIGSYGVEGEAYDTPNSTYYYTDDGSIMKTDWVINNDQQQAVAWFMFSYQQVSFLEPIRHIHLANYAMEGGDRLVDAFYLWAEDYYAPDPDTKYDWPSASAKVTDEQQADLNTFITDTNTWFSENYALFFDGSVELTRANWDSYVSELYNQGYQRYQDIMQAVYDDYMEKRAEQLG